MQSSMRIHLALAVVAAMALWGCGRNTVSGPGSGGSSDQAEVTSAMAQSPAVIEDGEFDSQEPTTLGGGAQPASLETAISPLRYWRTITDVQRRFEFAFSDTDSTGRPTTALVTIHKHLLGRFNILVGVPGSDSVAFDSTYRTVHKPLDDRWVRHVLLKRVRLTENGRPVWRIVATSGVRVTSKDATTQIVSVRVQTADLDTTLTDPSRLFGLRRLLQIAPGTRVTLTVTTGRSDDVVVLQLRGHRFRFHDNGDNTYTGVWTVPDFAPPGPHHFGVNALSNGTLFDDAAPYDSQAWLFPFVISSNEVAADLP